MRVELNKTTGNGKAGYVRPQLTVFGSVRNLTGGSSGLDNDGAGTMHMSDATMGMA